jgi:hypothetical protein
MLIAVSKYIGNVVITGKLTLDTLEIVNPHQREKDEIARGSFADKVNAPILNADEIETRSLKICAGARVWTRRLTASLIDVKGHLRANEIFGNACLSAGKDAVVDATICGDVSLRLHRLTKLRGGIRQLAQDNVMRACELLEAPLSRLEAFTHEDFTWLEAAHQLAGWECAARSSSGNGCNYHLPLEDGTSVGYHYVPLRVGIHDYESAMRSALRRLTVPHGYEF